MKLFDISNRGLAVISVLVALLWGLIFAERAITQRARRDYIEYLRTLPATPANSQPLPFSREPSAPLPEDTYHYS